MYVLDQKEFNRDEKFNFLDSISDLLISVTDRYEIEYVNSVVLTFFNIREEDVIGSSLDRLLPEAFMQHLTSITDGQKTIIEFELLKPKCHFFEAHIYPSSSGFSIILLDKTLSKKIEKEIEGNYNQVLFLTEASHDIIINQEPKELLDSLFHRLSNYLDVDVYFNYILDEEKEKLSLLNYHGIPDDTANEIKWLELGQAVCGLVARDQERIIAENVQDSKHPSVSLIRGLGVKAYVCHPLIAYNRLLGTLSFGSTKRSTFTSSEIDLIEKICNQVASKLERLFLIKELKENNTRLLETNEKLQEAMEKAEGASKAKTNFLLMMSHELRTPLNTVIGYAQLLDGNDNLTESQKQKIRRLLDSSKHLSNLINEVLEIVRMENGSMKLTLEQVNVMTCTEEAISIIDPIAIRRDINVDLIVDGDRDHFIIESNKLRIIQMLVNILNNGVKYNQDKGSLAIFLKRKNNQILISVEDTGIGIVEEDLKQIFDPFYRATEVINEVEGLGIGLSLVKRIACELGGSIDVTSEYRCGTLVNVRLPVK